MAFFMSMHMSLCQKAINSKNRFNDYIFKILIDVRSLLKNQTLKEIRNLQLEISI